MMLVFAENVEFFIFEYVYNIRFLFVTKQKELRLRLSKAFSGL